MVTGLLPSQRVTQDCDVIQVQPEEALDALLNAARTVALDKGLPEEWFNAQAMQLNVLPDGWHSRRIFVGRYGQLSIYAVSRLDLLAMKFYANRPQDREDILYMKPTPDEIVFIRKYLNMLRVPSRQADLDQVVSAFKLVDAIEEIVNENG